jgi:hypothetical protein
MISKSNAARGWERKEDEGQSVNNVIRAGGTDSEMSSEKNERKLMNRMKSPTVLWVRQYLPAITDPPPLTLPLVHI